MSARKSNSRIGRRTFLAGTAATTFTLVHSSQVRGSKANSTIKLGMLGCGGRGKWIAPLFQKNGDYKFVACADYYKERVDKFGEEFGVPEKKRFTTLSAYKKLLEEDIDAVVIETPPYFHPEHAAAAVDARKHVFLAKPIAVDVPGCLSIAKSGMDAFANKLVFLVDFQTRADPYYQEAAKRVHDGEIGKLVTGEARYPWAGGAMPPPLDPHDRLRRWYCIKELSGDFIIEQNIHTLDVATWFIDADPIKAYGAGGKGKTREYGNIWDHFNCVFHFPEGVILSYLGVQVIPGCPDEIPCRIYGTDGVVDTDYFGHVWIRGRKPYEGAKLEGLYTTGAVNNIKNFHRFITEGHYMNETVAPSVRSNLTCVLGREAGYKGGVLTWDEMMRAKEKLVPDLKGLKS